MASRKNRTTLGAIAFILLLGLTFVALDQRDKPSGEDADLPVVNLPQSSVTELHVTRPGEETTVIRKSNGKWKITAPVEARANNSAVHDALWKLSETKVKSLVASDPNHYERLEVDPTRAVHVSVRHGSGQVTELDIGKYANGYTMARVNGSEAVYGLEGEFLPSVDKKLENWRDTSIVGVNPAALREVVYDTDRGRYHFVRDLASEELPWAQAEGDEPIENLDIRRVGGLASSVANLRAVGFAPRDVDPADAGFEPPRGTIELKAEAGGWMNPRSRDLPSEGDDEPIELTVELGGPASEKDRYYVRLKGSETIYELVKHTYDRLRPSPKMLQAKAEPQP